MNEVEVDVVVIGLGPGGEDVAGNLAEAGLRVVGIEASLVGGECPYWGCVPSKMMIRAANLLAEARRIPGVAGEVIVTPHWEPVAARIRRDATDNWDDSVAVKRFEDKGGIFVRGHGRLDGPGVTVCGDQRFRAKRAIVLATGARPTIPPIPGLSTTPYWTNHDVIEAAVLPQSVIVIGGGAIGVELSQVLARFGVKVTIIDSSARLLGVEEPEVDAVIRRAMELDGAAILTGVQTTNVVYADDEFQVTLDTGQVLIAERLLVATGRAPDLTQLGLETIGMHTDAPSLTTDATMRAGDNLWAVGDITGHGAFTHMAMYQSRIATAAILNEPVNPANYSAVPRVTFTDPEVGSVGMTERSAQEAGLDVGIGFVEVASTARGWIHQVPAGGFIKLVADMKQRAIVGATVVSPTGGEVLGLLTLAVHEQVKLERLDSMICAYPTFHRGISDALATLIKDTKSKP